MPLTANTGDVLLQVQTSVTMNASDRATLVAAARSKIAAIDTTDARLGWTFTLGPDDPTDSQALKTTQTFVRQLVGDESIDAISDPVPSDFYYCVAESYLICYRSFSLIRTAASADAPWGGSNGVNSIIAWQGAAYQIPMKAIYRFARSL